MAQSKTYLEYEYELRPYKVKITRIGKDGKGREVEITQYYYTRVEDDTKQ